jgi:DNA (cytosine-5)-methyltransferase 1
LSLGLSSAGFSPVLAADLWGPAEATYRHNFPSTRFFPGDLSDVGPIELLAEAGLSFAPDVIAGGPPCQGFSSAGSRTPDDARNNLVSVFARLVAAIKPPAFLFENVEGFLTARGGDFVLELLEPVIEAGYHVGVAKLNVANYGVPQLRKRVIAIGTRRGVPTVPEPTHRAWGAPGVENVGSPDLPRTPSVRAALADLPRPSRGGDIGDHVASQVSAEDAERIRALKPGWTMRDLPEELQHPSYARRAYRRVRDGTPTERRGGAPAGLRRLRADEPSKAITGAASRELIHPTANRPLTLRECARIQTFPDEFRFQGNRSERMLLIGNAVPPQFGEVLGRVLLRSLDTRAREHRRGKLVCFHATSGNGMSPALRRTVDRVSDRFGPERQLALEELWD